MTTLVVGFDSAWTPKNSGAIVAVLRTDEGKLIELGSPRLAGWRDAEEAIVGWQRDEQPTRTVVLLDQPTIVTNTAGQRPVENVVASLVSRRFGGMQPASTSRTEMFGVGAPVWRFLERFGGAADPHQPVMQTRVFETYPVLVMIALGWMLPDARRANGRLPKYNPERGKTFSAMDWRHVCQRIRTELEARRLSGLAEWLDNAAESARPRKREQDCVDACICLLAALYLVERRECLMIGNMHTGYIVVPSGRELQSELEARCAKTARAHTEWLTWFICPADYVEPPPNNRIQQAALRAAADADR